MKIALILFKFLVFLSISSHANHMEYMDELQDTAKISAFIEKGHGLLDSNPDSSLNYALRAIDLSQTNNQYKLAEAKRLKMIFHYYRGEIKECLVLIKEILPLLEKSSYKKKGAACNNMGLMYTEINQADSAEIYYDSAFYFYGKLSDPYIQGMADAYANKATLEIERGNPELALEYNFKSLDLFNEKEHPKDVAQVYNNIGSLYLRMFNYKKAQFYLEKSLELKKAEEMFSTIANTYALLGNTYQAMENYPKADSCFQQALDYERKMGNLPQEGSTLGSLAQLYFTQGLFELALKTAIESEKIKKEFSNENEYASSQYLLGKIYLAMGQNELSRKSLAFAESAFVKTGNHLSLLQVLKERSLLEEISRKPDLALEFERRAYEISQSILNEEKAGMMVKMEARYQNALKEGKIQSLSVQSLLDQANIKKQRLFLILLGAGAIILAGMLFFMYRGIVHRKRLYKQEQINRKKEQELASLKSMITGEEKERTRIAKDLHDGLSGLLAAIKMKLNVVQQESEQLQNHDNFNVAVQSLDEASNEVRRIAHNMVPQLLMRFGLIEALKDYLKNIDGINGLRVKFRHFGMDERLNPQTELTLYRIVQELLNNILKHSDASEVLLEITKKDDLLMLTVEDNGLGFDVEKTNSDGIGLDNLASRVDFLGGAINIKTAPEQGTSVYIEITLRKEVIEQ